MTDLLIQIIDLLRALRVKTVQHLKLSLMAGKYPFDSFDTLIQDINLFAHPLHMELHIFKSLADHSFEVFQGRIVHSMRK